MKQSSQAKPFDYFLHPYVFVLKEGQEIHKDFLDYSLLLLQVGQVDILPSPSTRQKIYPILQLKRK